MSGIVAISTVTAKKLSPLSDILIAAQAWLANKPSEFDLFERFHQASGTKNRSYVIPPHELLSLGGQGQRAELFLKHGVPLGCQAVELALSKAGMSPIDIDTLILTSCTCPVIPSLDAQILQQFQFAPTVKRIPMYQQGCAGGVVGLSLADRLSFQGENVLLVSIELCSLLFRFNESEKVDLLGSALFADGASASIISSRRKGLTVTAAQSYLIPETGHLMGYKIKDDGAHLLLDRDLPQKLQNVLPGIVQKFLNQLNLSKEDFPWWVIHPGGVKILDGIANLLDLKRHQYSWAYDVLSNIGNMSSATVQFVLSACLESGELKPGQRLMMIGIGPGLTVELIAFENA